MQVSCTSLGCKSRKQVSEASLGSKSRAGPCVKKYIKLFILFNSSFFNLFLDSLCGEKRQRSKGGAKVGLCSVYVRSQVSGTRLGRALVLKSISNYLFYLIHLSFIFLLESLVGEKRQRSKGGAEGRSKSRTQVQGQVSDPSLGRCLC